MTLTQVTDFPRRDTTRLIVRVKKPQTFALRVRHPGWCAAATIRVNGDPHTVSRAAGTYVEVKRKWRDGDTVYTEVALPDGADVDGFGLHPALADAALHGLALIDG